MNLIKQINHQTLNLTQNLCQQNPIQAIKNLFQSFSDRKSYKSIASSQSNQSSPQTQQKQKKQQNQQNNNSQVNILSSEELQSDFKENKTIMESLNCNIDNLFKKITQLTDEVYKDLRPTRTSIQENIKSKSPQSRQSCSLQQKSPTLKLQKIRSSPKQETKRYQIRQIKHAFSFNCVSQGLIQTNLSKQKTIRIRDFQLGKTLGYGKFGEAFLCKHKQTGFVYAVKKIFKSTIQQYKMQQQMINEIQALKRLDHKNIVKVYNAFSDQFFVFLLMELATGKPLTKKFKSIEKEVAFIMKQVLEAIDHMHKQGIVHRDIKPQNILYNQETGQVKICDLGWSSIDGKDLDIVCGTLDYICPQMTQNKIYSNSVDLWCVGVLSFELLFGYAPFKAKQKGQIFDRIKNVDLLYPEQIQVSQQAKSFIQGFLRKQNDRKDVQWGLNHQFIKKYCSQQIQDIQLLKQLEQCQLL